jgi:nucleoside-diphosphate-sugar epimerase
MDILIIGGAGMLGQKLAQSVQRQGGLGGKPVGKITLADMVMAAKPAGPAAVEVVVVDLAQAGALIAARPDVIFHLAAVVSGEAEADFDKGYAVNLDGSRNLFEAIRAQGRDYCPRVVFASSTAVFGAPFPDEIGDEFCVTPASSYGTQKAITELLLNDYSRRGIFDGVGLRLPTICIRPGTPNRAASGFFSNILREPLVGLPAVLPVRDTLRHWFASPRAAVGFFERAASMDLAGLGVRRCLNMPGLSATVAEEIEALRRVAGQGAVDLIRLAPDPAIAAIVETWPQRFETARAESLGFVAETSFDQIIAAHITDELGG